MLQEGVQREWVQTTLTKTSFLWPFIACWWTISLERLEPKGCFNNESWQFENSFKMFGFTRSDETNRWIAPPLHISCAATCNNYLSGLVSVYSYCSSFQELFSSTNNSSMFPFQLITMCMDELQISSLASGWVFVFLSTGLCSENSWLLLAAGTFHDQMIRTLSFWSRTEWFTAAWSDSGRNVDRRGNVLKLVHWLPVSISSAIYKESTLG